MASDIYTTSLVRFLYKSLTDSIASACLDLFRLGLIKPSGAKALLWIAKGQRMGHQPPLGSSYGLSAPFGHPQIADSEV